MGRQQRIRHLSSKSQPQISTGPVSFSFYSMSFKNWKKQLWKIGVPAVLKQYNNIKQMYPDSDTSKWLAAWSAACLHLGSRIWANPVDSPVTLILSVPSNVCISKLPHCQRSFYRHHVNHYPDRKHSFKSGVEPAVPSVSEWQAEVEGRFSIFCSMFVWI